MAAETSDPKVVRLDERVLGTCPACALDVCFGDNYIRLSGQAVHLQCVLEVARARREPDNRPTHT